MPRVQDAIPSLDCRAWKGHSNPLLLSTLRFAPESRPPLRSKPSGPTGVIQEVQNYSQFGQARRHRPENDQKLSPRLRQTARWQPSQRHGELNIAKMMVADER